MTIPASTTLDQRTDRGAGEHRGAHLSLVREESPAVRSFPDIPTVAKPLGVFETPVTKPLGAFEAVAAETATTPVTWGAGNA
jgi:hypothetical protein